jgi:hypothetical protein
LLSNFTCMPLQFIKPESYHSHGEVGQKQSDKIHEIGHER